MAELTAAVLANLYGQDLNIGNHYRYISQYAREAGADPYWACMGVLQDVKKCLDLIITKHALTEAA